MSDFAWLIEAPGAHYLAVRQLSSNPPDFIWTTDANRALRFWSKEQADLTAGGVRALNPGLWGFALTLGEAWPREHGWIAVADAAEPLSDEQLAAANTAYTRALFPECSAEQLADEWARMTPDFRLNTQEAMRAAITAALSVIGASPAERQGQVPGKDQ